jgi:mannose-6-phosphate isomerase-like protein (cupin superfamily)
MGGLYWRVSLMYRGRELERLLEVNGQFSVLPDQVQNSRQDNSAYRYVFEKMWVNNRLGSSFVYAAVITAWLFTSIAGFAGSVAKSLPVLSSPIVYAICIVVLFVGLTRYIHKTRLESFDDAWTALDKDYAHNIALAVAYGKKITQDKAAATGAERTGPMATVLARTQATVSSMFGQRKPAAGKGRYLMRTYHRGDDPDHIAPDGVEIRNLVDETQGAQKLSVAEGLMKQGQRSNKVYHTSYEEIWYFLQGSGTFHLHRPDSAEEEAMAVHPGDSVLVPPRYGFWAENTSEHDLVFLLCGSPPWGTGQTVLPWPPGSQPGSATTP